MTQDYTRENINSILKRIRINHHYQSTMYKRINSVIRIHKSVPINQVIDQIPATIYKRMQSIKLELYEAGNYTFNPPGVCSEKWTVNSWINHIDHNGLWLVARKV